MLRDGNTGTPEYAELKQTSVGIGMEKESFSKKISFLRPGWWLVHLAGISSVYALGHFLWK